MQNKFFVPSFLISTQTPTTIGYCLHCILAKWVREVKKEKKDAKASRKAAALPVKGGSNTYMTKGKLATECQESSHQHQQVMEVTTPMKPPPMARESISDAT
jgi:hypothetical protein